MNFPPPSPSGRARNGKQRKCCSKNPLDRNVIFSLGSVSALNLIMSPDTHHMVYYRRDRDGLVSSILISYHYYTKWTTQRPPFSSSSVLLGNGLNLGNVLARIGLHGRRRIKLGPRDVNGNSNIHKDMRKRGSEIKSFQTHNYYNNTTPD